jgi:hypothetical protein
MVDLQRQLGRFVPIFVLFFQVLSKEIILNNIWYISVFKITGEKFH